MTHCDLWHQLNQRRYIALLKNERAEAQRLAGEMTAHETKCLECSGFAPSPVPLVDQLFGAHVIVKETE